MKPVFSTDSSLGRKNTVYNADKFTTARVSETTEEKLVDAEIEKYEQHNKVQGPRWLKLLKEILPAVGILILVIAYAVYMKNGKDTAFKLAPLFLACLALVYIGFFFIKRHIKRLNTDVPVTDEMKRANMSYDSAVRAVLDELGIPQDARAIDTIYFDYKLKDGEMKSLSKLVCDIQPVRAFKKGNILYLADFSQRLEIPLTDSAYIERVYDDVNLYTFEVESGRSYKDPKYSIEGVELSLDDEGNAGNIKISSYGIYRFTHEGEEYGIYIPNYDIPTFEEILNS